jgi:divalent metal cation (Fe/Co/Zn/Cd) transporter
MAYHELLMKLMEGITDASVRADIVTAFSYIVEAYRSGRIDDARLKRDLNELCLDVLVVKYPTKDVEELKSEAEEWSEKLYRVIKVMAVRERTLARSGLRE